MKEHLIQLIQTALQSLQAQEPQVAYTPCAVQIERTRDKKNGDYATNIAFLLTKKTGLSAPELAARIIKHLPASQQIEKVELAGPGFINFFLAQQTEYQVISRILSERHQYGRSQKGQGKRVHIEFVSANPTGPLHVGHGRGAAYGATCANLLEAMGYSVHREYYVNDAGRQMDILAASLFLRYLELFGETLPFPKNGYQGHYIIDIARELKNQNRDEFYHPSHTLFSVLPENQTDEVYLDALIAQIKTLLGARYEKLHQFGADRILADIRDDLHEFGVDYQEWFSEKSLAKSGAIQKSMKALEQAGYLYQKDGATWFQSTHFGDEKDRVLVRENGLTTYFASDVAYHFNKLQRGFQIIIDILGADHHGYIPRVKAAMTALGLNPQAFHAPLVQFAILYQNGERVSMSTRSGQFVTLRQLREDVGNDAARFFYIVRKSDQHMDFDLDLAKSKSNENPVYYVQYAHARICSVFRQLHERNLSGDLSAGISELTHLRSPHETLLLKLLAQYPEVICTSAEKLEPHHLANFLRELATAFHTYYNAEQFLVDNMAVRNARLVLIEAIRQVITNGLELLGVSTPEQM